MWRCCRSMMGFGRAHVSARRFRTSGGEQHSVQEGGHPRVPGEESGREHRKTEEGRVGGWSGGCSGIGGLGELGELGGVGGVGRHSGGGIGGGGGGGAAESEACREARGVGALGAEDEGRSVGLGRIDLEGWHLLTVEGQGGRAHRQHSRRCWDCLDDGDGVAEAVRRPVERRKRAGRAKKAVLCRAPRRQRQATDRATLPQERTYQSKLVVSILRTRSRPPWKLSQCQICCMTSHGCSPWFDQE